MARYTRTIVSLTDDLDGSEATETVSFALDGAAYEIDLNEANAGQLRDALAVYVGAARKTRGGRGRRGGGPGRRAAGSSSGNSGDIRAWARQNGYAVSERGRISADIQAAYEAAH